jgi:hypothetical protein
MADTPVYLEVGKKRVFAGAIEWPGWCRGGRDEDAALRALIEAAPRYARAMQAAGITFEAPPGLGALAVAERLDGNSTTDFGAPDLAPAADARPLDTKELRRQQDLLRAIWQALDAAAQAAQGRELRTGPRGGGRDLEKIIRHVLGAEQGYLSRLAWPREKHADGDLQDELDRTRQAVLDAVAAAARGELPERGPRGGTIWAPRYFVRRVAWHALDHAWEIEDRAGAEPG